VKCSSFSSEAEPASGGAFGYRHGRKTRELTLRAGMLNLAVPRARLVNQEGEEREWRSQLLPPMDVAPLRCSKPSWTRI
jgi:hypothetical protein